MTWHVDPTKRWDDDVNFGRLCHMLEITTACELCHYSEGRPDKVIDLTRTPEQDCYRRGMQVFLQQKMMAKTPEQRLASQLGINFSDEDQRLLRKLRQTVLPALGPEDPCPLCTRTLAPIDPSEFGSQANMSGLESSPSKMFASASFRDGGSQWSPNNRDAIPNDIGGSVPVIRPEVGVQCGQASRLGDRDEVISLFGTAARMREHSGFVFNGPPTDFPSRAQGSDFDLSPTILDLKSQAEQFQRERDQLALELREVTKQKTMLERWKQEHRCEVSAEVAKTRKEMETLQVHLRELMRGREEVFAMLQQRRMQGSVYAQETPRPYAPFTLSLPSLDSPPPDPHKLLARESFGKGGLPTDSFSYSTQNLPKDAAEKEASPAAIEVVKRPSGKPTTASLARTIGLQDDGAAEDLLAKQAVGECMLRVASNFGDAFSVKRKLGSQMRNGRHIFTLSSLDGVITDEIHVEELVSVSLQGLTGLHMATSLHSWQIHLNPAERQRWLHWLYALNPYLSASAQMSSGGVPNSY